MGGHGGSHLATRCLYQTGTSDLRSVTKVVTHMAIRCLYLGECQVDICSIGSQPAATGQPTSLVTNYQPFRLWNGQIFGGRRTGRLTTLGTSPGSQRYHWFPFGSDLPVQGQASNTNELCIPLHIFGTMFRDHL